MPAASASPGLLVGINDEANTLYGNPTTTFRVLKELRTQVIRVNLYWGGNKYAVAKRRPTDATDPGDRAYDWRLYDRLVRYASQNDIKVMFSILFTPAWASGGAARTHVPRDFKDLENFAYAAAERYSGLWTPPPWQQDPTNESTKLPLPRVSFWTAWNEPNNPIWLAPQYRRVGGRWVMQSAIDYVKICRAIDAGVHSPYLGPLPGEKVACGVTGPRGNNAPTSSRPSIAPLSFVRALKRYGLRGSDFDVYAHHPYYASPKQTPTSPPSSPGSVELGNIDTLLSTISSFWGPKHLWITEYAYETMPPDKRFGVSWAKQAAYLEQAYAIARRNPRIDMLIWFLLKDDSVLNGWQSGLLTAAGHKKPSFAVFQHLPHP